MPTTKIQIHWAIVNGEQVKLQYSDEEAAADPAKAAVNQGKIESVKKRQAEAAAANKTAR